MSADLTLRVIDDSVTDADLALLRGTPLTDENGEVVAFESRFDEAGYDAAFMKVYDREGGDDKTCWIGQVSWIKEMLDSSPDGDRYVPATVRRIASLFDEEFTPAVLTNEMATEIKDAFNLPNRSIYQPSTSHRGLADPAQVAAWLDAHQGSRLLCVSE